MDYDRHNYFSPLAAALAGAAEDNSTVSVSVLLSSGAPVAGDVLDMSGGGLSLRARHGDVAHVRLDAIDSYIIKGR